MKNLPQNQINLLKSLAEKYDLRYEKVRELLGQVGMWSSRSISTIKKAEDKLYDPESASTIHITRFGKLIPDKARMNKVREYVTRTKNAKQKD